MSSNKERKSKGRINYKEIDGRPTAQQLAAMKAIMLLIVEELVEEDLGKKKFEDLEDGAVEQNTYSQAS